MRYLAVPKAWLHLDIPHPAEPLQQSFNSVHTRQNEVKRGSSRNGSLFERPPAGKRSPGWPNRALQIIVERTATCREHTWYTSLISIGWRKKRHASSP